MGWIGETVESIRSIQIRQLLTQAVSLGAGESPVVIFMMFESMEPRFKRGDILFLRMSKDPFLCELYMNGRTLVKLKPSKKAITMKVMTVLYAKGQLWLERQHIMGRAMGFLPYVGWVTIIMTKKPIIKVYSAVYSRQSPWFTSNHFKGPRSPRHAGG